MAKKQKILVAVDGTDVSRKVIRYCFSTLSAQETEVTLFQVVSHIPEVFCDLKKDPETKMNAEVIAYYAKKEEESASEFMREATGSFLGAGFGERSVIAKIHGKKEGIARDIISYARDQEYTTLVLGRNRQGSSDTLLGSVACKILSVAPTASLWLVGRNPSIDRVLIAIDRSENAEKGVRYAGEILARTKASITLFYVIRDCFNVNDGLEKIVPDSYRDDLTEEARHGIIPAMKTAESILARKSIAPSRVAIKIVTGVKSRAATIAEEARRGGYGTIVVGRNGLSEVNEFSMGRVPTKLVQLVSDQALWIVG